MTNEEAIEQLERMIYYYESLDMDDEEEKDLEALKMAVCAIEEKESRLKHDKRKRTQSIG